MCIRDRCFPHLNCHPEPIGEGSLGLSRDADGTASALRCICLLYTSDAADERSSVDLGGRRIIKKKTMSELVEVLRSIPQNK